MAKNKGFSLTKWVFFLVIIAALAGGGLWYWKNSTDKGPDYKTAPVALGDLIQAVTATGQLNPLTNVQVGSQVSGIITNIYVDFNSRVTNHQVIAQLDPATYQAIVAQARAEVASAKAGLELAQAEADRSKTLNAAKIVAQSEYDTAEATLHQAQAGVMMKEASLQQAQANLAYTTIYAPVDGFVISRNVDVGQTVAASLSTPTLFMIANDLTKMQIDALISEADIGGIETNQTVNFSVDAFPTRTFHGVVWQVRNAPITNQNVITYDAVIRVDNSDLKLRPGMTANVSIITAEKHNALKIPNAALRFHPAELDAKNGVASADTGGGQFRSGAGGGGGGERGSRSGEGGGDRPKGQRRSPMRTIYVPGEKGPDGAKSEIAKPVQIRTGISDGLSTEVVEGLKEGDLVIVGQTVTASASSQSAPANPFGGGGRRF
jgi:HlyD family secretion protein